MNPVTVQGSQRLPSHNLIIHSTNPIPKARKMTRAGVSTRKSCSQANVEIKNPTKIASLSTVARLAGGLVGKRRFKKAVTGSIDPEMATTSRNKNNQRGPNVGRVWNTTAINPTQPIKARVNAVNKKLLTGGEVYGFIEVVT